MKFKNVPKSFFWNIYNKIVKFFRYLGGIFLLSCQTIFWMLIPPYRKKSILEQMNQIGVASFPIVFLISLFTGIVLALQSAYQMQKVGAEMYIASLVALSLTRELGPVLTALIVAGRSGAAITAEVGTMKVTEQIDALETLSVNPVEYLIVPRFVALLVVVPLLTIYADFFGIVGGYLIGVGKLGITHNMYVNMTFDPMTMKDIVTGLIKSFSFAFIICMVSCFEGMRSEEGAEGVGRATTASVVRSFILIIMADCFFTALFYFMNN
ncbi:ABC transporter permease [Candidatus Omnitrophus magneticus]|uniref:ABC transporter permease n=1 Tax=Candidatus Omnitrophus magneticus TaxID=1609969 RepID=A0A0F0CLC2_9BACT|nr:ABC transporter permease [Candidatus Omnitrophus magneticus]